MADSPNYISARIPFLMDLKTNLISREWFRLFTLFISKADILVGTQSTTVGVAGPAAALPATPEGYFTINFNGVDYKVPYYKS